MGSPRNEFQYCAADPLASIDPSGFRITKFICCNNAEIWSLKAADAAVSARLPIVIADVTRYTAAYTFEWAMENNRIIHGTGRQQTSKFATYRRDLLTVLNAISAKLFGGYKAECHDDEDPYAWVTWWDYKVGNLIHFNESYFGLGMPVRNQTLLHELSHLASWTKDLNMGWHLCYSGFDPAFHPERGADDTWYIEKFQNGDAFSVKKKWVLDSLFPIRRQ